MPPRETDLYAPIKSFLEGQGYDVKGEVADCDVVAVRAGEGPVIVELKTSFSLQLVFQAVRRQALTDTVYVAYGATPGRTRRNARDIMMLCRRLGLGLITVRTSGRGSFVEVHLDPGPYKPRQNKRKRGMLLREFQRRVGDPNVGGANKRPVMTAYRQDALRCAQYLRENGPSKPAVIKAASDVEKAARILQNDVYGWFHRVERGIYALTPAGKRALKTYADVVKTLAKRGTD
jgi:hypothetical protein